MLIKFDLYIYHVLVLVIVKHNGDEPPKKCTRTVTYAILDTMQKSSRLQQTSK